MANAATNELTEEGAESYVELFAEDDDGDGGGGGAAEGAGPDHQLTEADRAELEELGADPEDGPGECVPPEP